MKISYSWLKDFIELQETPEQIADLLTASGLETEGLHRVERIKGGLKNLVIGQVVTCEKHPDTDRLKVTTVDVGESSPIHIVCGAPNVAVGQKVIVALPGAVLYPLKGESFVIKKSKIRGAVSEGMICAEDEIGIGESHEGILVLQTDPVPGTPAAEYFNLADDVVFEIGLTPNRSDAASHLGVARELKVLLDKLVSMPSVEHFSVDTESYYIPVTIENPEACPRYSSVVIADVCVGESPDWLKTKLEAIGITPINNIVDITNYILHGFGQPLHAFDADKISGRHVVVKTLAEDTSFITLDGKERKLGKEDLMICDIEKPLCMAGIFGGKDSGISDTTKNVFLESAYFSPEYIRRTAKRHDLKTDASFRYERGTDPEITVYALKLAALLIKEIAGGKIASAPGDLYLKPVPPAEISLRYQKIDRLIGQSINKQFIKKVLGALDIEVKEELSESLRVSVPSYRTDVRREVDLIEEILRIYGYNNIVLEAHTGTSFTAVFPEKDPARMQMRITELLVANGFFEVINNSLGNPLPAERLRDVFEGEPVKIANPLSEELSSLRQTLLYSGLETIAYNINRKQKNLNIFEFGKIYAKTASGYTEKQKLGIWITGLKHPETWQLKSTNADFWDMQAVVDKLLLKAGVAVSEQEVFSDSVFESGVKVKNSAKTVVFFGKIRKEVLKNIGIDQSVFFAEADIDSLFRSASSAVRYREISKFPEVRRDLSLVVSKKILFADIKKLAFETDRKILREVNVFDVYEGENIGLDKKSYSVSFMLQHDDRTLTDREIDALMNRLMETYEMKISALIRK